MAVSPRIIQPAERRPPYSVYSPENDGEHAERSDYHLVRARVHRPATNSPTAARHRLRCSLSRQQKRERVVDFRDRISLSLLFLQLAHELQRALFRRLSDVPVRELHL